MKTLVAIGMSAVCLTLVACDTRTPTPTEKAYLPLRVAICGKFKDCGVPTPKECCFTYGTGTVSEETQKAIDACLSDLNVQGCNWQEYYSSNDAGGTSVRTISLACREVFAQNQFEANGSRLLPQSQTPGWQCIPL
jgi:hypothetical protein